MNSHLDQGQFDDFVVLRILENYLADSTRGFRSLSGLLWLPTDKNAPNIRLNLFSNGTSGTRVDYKISDENFNIYGLSIKFVNSRFCGMVFSCSYISRANAFRQHTLRHSLVSADVVMPCE
jgi:hypothetical protein